MVHVTFGLDLDQGSYPSVLTGEEASMGFPVVGPRRLYHLLETHTGLLARHASHAQRIAAYAQRLAAADRPSRFFHRSLQCDAWGTATVLLRDRDRALLAGWEAAPSGDPRMDDLCEVEQVSSPALPAGMAERTHALLEVLPRTRLPLTAFTHVEPLHLLPSHLRRLLEACRVPLTGMALPPPIDPSTDLGMLQRALSGHAAGRPRGDGTVIFLRADDTWQAADLLAAWLAFHRDELIAPLIIRGGHPDILDRSLQRQGFACLGSSRRSTFRPATQVLPLALALTWSPLDPLRLIEFLTLPVSPLPARCRRTLARTFCDTPGVHGKAWRSACEHILEQGGLPPKPAEWTDDADLAAELDLLRGSGDRHRSRGEQRSTLPRALEEWLGPEVLAAHAPERGVPRQVAVDIARRTARWARGRARHDDSGIFRVAATQAADLARAVAAWPRERIPRPQMDQIISCVTGSGALAFSIAAEAGHLPVVDHPGSLLDDVDDVIWWDFTQPATPGDERPFSADVDSGFAGLALEEPFRAAKCQDWRWRLPIVTARRRLVLAIPSDRQVHPLFHEIRGRLCPTGADEERLTRGVADQLRLLPTSSTAPAVGSVAPVAWTVPTELLVPRRRESASSLRSLIACPLQWFLQYMLGMRPGPLAGVSDGMRLAGQLAHVVFEDVFTVGAVELSPCEAHNRAVAAFDARIGEVATPLQQAHRTMERAALREQVAEAAAVLTRVLRESSMQIVGTEVELESRELCGRVDLLLEAAGRKFVVDLKGTEARHLRKQLEDGEAVQLAVYADLVQTEDVAFFSVSSAELLAPSGASLAGSTVAGPPIRATKEKVRRALEERRAQLEGRLVMIGGHLEDGMSLSLEPGCLVCEYGAFCQREGHRHGG